MQRNIRVLTWFNFFSEFKLYAPLAIVYFAQVSGSFALGMAVFSIARIFSAAFEIPTGVFSDRIGRKKTMILGSLSAILFTIFYAIGGSFWFLVIGAILEGLSISFYSGNNNALLHDTLKEADQTDKYAEVLGKTSKMFPAALAISALLGGLFSLWSLSLIVWLSVIPQILCLFLAFLIKDPATISRMSGNIYQNLKEAYLQFVRNKKLRYLSLTSILSDGFGEAGFTFQSAFYQMIWPIWAIPIAKTISYIGATAGFHYAGRIIKKFNIYKVLIAGNFYTRSLYLFATGIPTVFSPLLLSFSSLFYGSVIVGRGSLMQGEYSDERRATMGSLNSFAGSIFFGIVSFTLGFVADLMTPRWALFFIQFFHLTTVIFYWKLYKIHKS